MKLSKSKLAMAKVINENGGWKSGGMFSSQDGNGRIDFYQAEPHRIEGNGWWTGDYDDELGITPRTKTPNNWHKTILSREEYYQAYPKADADGWIEWNGGMKSPVESGVYVDVKTRDGNEHYDQLLGDVCWHDNWGDANIIAYRLHKPDVKPEFCESVMRSIPEPEEVFSKGASIPHTPKCRCKVVDVKPTIEQLAQDYRNAKDYADRIKSEATDAALKAESIRIEVMKRILELTESLK